MLYSGEKLNPCSCMQLSVKNETYAIQRSFVLVTKADTELTGAAKAFFDFITSEAAREVITAAGVVPAN